MVNHQLYLHLNRVVRLVCNLLHNLVEHLLVNRVPNLVDSLLWIRVLSQLVRPRDSHRCSLLDNLRHSPHLVLQHSRLGNQLVNLRHSPQVNQH